jgi:putative transposase
VKQKYQFVASQASEYPVSVLCRGLGLARSGYYAWKQQAPSARAQRDEQLLTESQSAFAASRHSYGSPRLHAELKARGLRCARKRGAGLMRQSGLVARKRRRRGVTTEAITSSQLRPTCWPVVFRRQRQTRSGSSTSPPSRPAKAGCIWLWCWTCSPGGWRAGRLA